MSSMSIARAAVLAAAALLAASSAAAQEKTVSIPANKIVLFTSGVGYFQHDGTVDGNARMELDFSTSGINDVLKSMILRDLNGGAVSSVTYASRDPITKALKSFALDLTGNPTLAGILVQARGKAVEVSAPGLLRGTVLGVEEQVRLSKDQTEVLVPILNLSTSAGIKSIPLSQIQTLKFADKAVQDDLTAALALISSSKDLDKKKVTLHFTGTGKRRVSIGYIQETPVWKTTYRLALAEDKTPFLQGWAVVENTSDRDWKDVALILVSGSPITFSMDLYTPLYVRRPEVRLDLYSSLVPQTYEYAMDGKEKSEEAVARPKAAPAPQVPSASVRGSTLGESGAPGWAEDGDISFGMASTTAAATAKASEIGELFQYALEKTVSLPRQQSALFPIVNQIIGGEKFSIYSESVDPKHPLNAVKLKNSSALHLMQGPVTVFDGSTYAGDARLSDFPPGAEQFISYAVDLDVEVAPKSPGVPQTLSALTISRGIVTTTYKQSKQRDYEVKNRGTRAASVIVEHPLDSTWNLVQPKDPMERTRSAYRFLIGVDAGKTKTLTVTEEKLLSQTVSANNLSADTIGIYIRSQVVSQSVKDALQKLLGLKQRASEAAAQRLNIETQVNDIYKEQTRIRENLKSIESGSTLYSRYTKTLNDQEDQLVKLNAELTKAREEAAARQKEVDAYILTIEAK
jgi:hypothetical protein